MMDNIINSREKEKNKVILYFPKTMHEKNYKFFWIPYSVLSIAAPLIDIGVEVQIIDGNLEEELNFSTDDLICVGISSMIGHQIEDGLEFCKKIRSVSNVPLIWGGAFPTLLPEVLIDSYYVDYIIRGPGDYLFADLVKSLKKGILHIDGIAYRNGNKKVLGEIQALPNRELLPKYPFNLIETDRYIRNDPDISSRVINYVSSQGCPFGCGFCTDVAIYNRKWSAYSAERTLEEIIDLTESCSANGVKFYDSNFFANPYRAMDFARGMIERKTNLKWAASAHPKNLLSLTDNDFKTLKESGLTRILVGAETGVQEELDFIGKNIKSHEIMELAKKLEYYNIICSFSFITAYPTMPNENIDKTIEFATKLAESTVGHEYKIHFFLPFPGTPLYDLAINNGFLPPKDLMGWSNLDYYYIETPWINIEYQDKIRKFNTKYCPYVSDI